MDPGTAIAIGQVSAKVLSIIWKYYSDVKDAKGNIHSLANELQDLHDVTLKVQGLLQNQPADVNMTTSVTLARTLEQTLLDIKDLEHKLDPGTGDKLMKRVGRRALKWPFAKKDVDEWIAKLQRFKSTLSLALNADQTSLLVDMKKLQITSEHERLLGKLPMASEASFNSYNQQYESRCMADTRIELLQHLQDWGTRHSQPIFWLSGMAGTGKSTISRTLAGIFDERNLLGGSFFFSRSSSETNNAARFVGTLANQLTSISPKLRDCICEAISAHSDTLRQGLRNQWEAFISGPLSHANFGRRPTVNFVIDALDECASENDIRLLLQLFVEVQAIDNVDLGIFITSRPEVAIRLGFKEMPEIIHYDLDLRDIPREIVDHDISVYLRQELRSISLEQGLDDWPSEADLQALVLKTDCLFIYAATACRFIRDKSWDPVERLSSVLGNRSASEGSTTQLDDMYTQVLRMSLTEGRSAREITMLCDRFQLVVGSIVALFDELSTFTLAHLLSTSIRSVEACLGSLHSVLNIPQEVHSPIRLLHPSFRDFLLDITRCGEKRFFKEETYIHEKLVTSCLEVISTSLTRNICQLPIPGSPVHEVNLETLDTRLPKHVQYACNHWVEHFVRTNQESTIRLCCGTGVVDRFFKEKFLNWLEVMSVMGRMTQAVSMIAAMSQKTEAMILDHNVAEGPQSLNLLLEDAKRFIFSHRGIIEGFPLQVYTSALVFSPGNSIIRKIYSHSFPAWLHRPPIVPKDWDNCVQTLYNPDKITTSIAFSPDGKFLACGLHTNGVDLWDLATGALHSTLGTAGYYVHNRSVSVAFSHNGFLATSSNSSIVRVLDPVTGQCLHEKDFLSNLQERPEFRRMHILERIRLKVKLAFLPNGDLVTSFGHGEVFIWDRDRDEVSELLHSEYSSWILWDCSVKGKLLLECREKRSASSDYLVYDSTTGTSMPLNVTGDGGQCSAAAVASNKYAAIAFSVGGFVLLDLTTGIQNNYCSLASLGWITALAFSPDNDQLGIGYDEGVVESLELHTGQRRIVGNCGWSSEVNAMTFSPDCKTIATLGSFQGLVHLWRDTTVSKTLLEEGGPFRGDRQFKYSISLFSPKLDLIAFFTPDYEDGSVQIYNTANASLTLELIGHTGTVKKLAFSADGRQLAAACKDRSMSIWNIQPEDNVKTTECEHLIPDIGHISALIFSPDGQQLALACNRTELQFWNPIKGALVDRFPAHGDVEDSIVYSSTGALIAFKSVDVKVFDVMSGDLLHSFEANNCRHVAFAPDSILFAYRKDDTTIMIHNLETDHSVSMLKTEDLNGPLALSPDNKLLARAAFDQFMVADVDTARITLRFHTPYQWEISQLEFTEDGGSLETDHGRYRIGQPCDHPASATSDARSCWRISDEWIDDEWILEGDRKMLWLPPRYRPKRGAHHDGFFVIFTKSGRIITMDFSKEPVCTDEEKKGLENWMPPVARDVYITKGDLDWDRL
ncbi:MAG: hypothetical protein Q9181_006365 [Wetmoreana brouardii]